MIDYKKISTPAPGELDEIIAGIREARKLREAFPLTEKQKLIQREAVIEYLEQQDEKWGYS